MILEADSNIAFLPSLLSMASAPADYLVLSKLLFKPLGLFGSDLNSISGYSPNRLPLSALVLLEDLRASSTTC